VPHCLQNRGPGSLSVPQFGQARPKGRPQFWQKRASGGFSK
jgi:hypothetical protein